MGTINLLRQLFIFRNSEVLYSYIFGIAYSSEILSQCMRALEDFIKDPVEGTIFNRPLFNFQVVYTSTQKLFFLFVADLSDRPENVKEIVKPTVAQFLATFPSIPDNLKDMERQNSFEKYLIEVHKNLHPKIAIVGPRGSGKTTLAQLIHAPGTVERSIMNFGKIYTVQIGKLTFDLWDWIFPDTFSPLWNNFVRGSDVLLVVIESTPDGLKGIGQFLTLHQREAKSARIAIICNHQDKPGALTPESISTQTGIKAYGISATHPDVKVQFIALLEQVLDLKKPLPVEFKQLLVLANDAIGKDDYETAIASLERLVAIAKEYQEMGYVQTFQDKLTIMKQKLAEKKKQEEREARKVKAPEIHKFTQKVEVKPLTVQQLPGAQKVLLKPASPISPGSLPPSPSPESRPIVEETTPPLSSNKVIVRDTRTTIAQPSPHEGRDQPVSGPVVFSTHDADVTEPPLPKKNEPDVPSLAKRLMERIQNLGFTFSLANCRVFIEKLVVKLGREPNNAELEKAAQALVAQVKRVKQS